MFEEKFESKNSENLSDLEKFKSEIQNLQEAEEKNKEKGEQSRAHFEGMDVGALTEEDMAMYHWAKQLQEINPESVSRDDYEKYYFKIRDYNEKIFGSVGGSRPIENESRKLFADYLSNLANMTLMKIQLKLMKEGKW